MTLQVVSHISEKNPNEIIGGYPVLGLDKKTERKEKDMFVSLKTLPYYGVNSCLPGEQLYNYLYTAKCNLNLKQLVFACITALRWLMLWSSIFLFYQGSFE